MCNNDLYENQPEFSAAEADSQQPLEALTYTPAQIGPAAPAASAPAKKRKATGKIVALALCCSLLGGALGAGGMALGLAAHNNRSVAMVLEGQRNTAALNVAYTDTSKEMTAAQLYAANVNSTVGITTSVNTNYFGYQTTSAASGSGFILTADGYIVTNYHVIESASTIKVTLYDDTSYDATLIGYDESNDVAVLKVEATDLTPVVLGDSDSLLVGDSVAAIGNPLGELTFSLTTGAISALDRTITLSSGVTMDLLQTDCAINSGNSGGPLFNMYGEVVGITNAKYSGSGSSGSASVDNIAFAIPINSVRSIVESIIEKGYIAKPYIGVTVSNVSSDAQAYGLPQGAAIQALTEDGPAEKAGLQVNDIVTAINGTTITTGSELVKLVGEAAVGETLTLSVYRQGETIDIPVTVGEKIQSAVAEEQTQTQQQQQQQQYEQYVDPWSYFGFGY